MSPEPIQIASEHPKTVPKVSRSIPEGSRTSQNHLGRSWNGREWSWKVLKASGMFRKFSDSTIGVQTPLALGDKAPQGGWPKFEGWEPLRSSVLRFPSAVLDSGSPHELELVSTKGERESKEDSPLWRSPTALGHL